MERQLRYIIQSYTEWLRGASYIGRSCWLPPYSHDIQVINIINGTRAYSTMTVTKEGHQNFSWEVTFTLRGCWLPPFRHDMSVIMLMVLSFTKRQPSDNADIQTSKDIKTCHLKSRVLSKNAVDAKHYVMMRNEEKKNRGNGACGPAPWACVLQNTHSSINTYIYVTFWWDLAQNILHNVGARRHVKGAAKRETIQ